MAKTEGRGRRRGKPSTLCFADMGCPDGAMGPILTYGNKEYISPCRVSTTGCRWGKAIASTPWTPQPP